MSDYREEDESESTFKYDERIEEVEKGSASQCKNGKKQKGYILAIPGGKFVSSSEADH